jgi:hypothetical protein
MRAFFRNRAEDIGQLLPLVMDGVELPIIDPRASKPAVVNIVLELFEATTRFVESPRVDSGLNGVKKELDDQLPELASVLFACIQERLGWLRWYAIAPFILSASNSLCVAVLLLLSQVPQMTAMNLHLDLNS